MIFFCPQRTDVENKQTDRHYSKHTLLVVIEVNEPFLLTSLIAAI